MRELVLIGIIIFIIIVQKLYKNKKIEKNMLYVWKSVGIIAFIVAIFPNLITKTAQLLGIYFPHTIIVLAGLLIIGIYVLYLSILVSKQSKMITNLTEELSILKDNIKK